MKIIKIVDDFLNKITMYKLALYCAGFLWALSFVLSFFKILNYGPLDMIGSLLLFFVVCFLVNEILAYIFSAPTNRESVYITALIMASIAMPTLQNGNIYFILWSGVFAMASKYILAIGKKHIFNPAAFGVAAASLVTNQSAIWQLGTVYMAPFVLIAGILIARKIKRLDLLLSFYAFAILILFGYEIYVGQSVLASLRGALFNSPVFYLGALMITEPMTTPPTKKLRIAYGALVGFLNAPFINIAGYYFTPEIALLVGNIFSYAVSPKEKLLLKLKVKNKIADNTYDFVFTADKKMDFKPGQYLEWTLDHKSSDNRGIRRYFTIASSPTEKDIIMGVKFYDKPSTYKQSLLSIKEGDLLVASQLAGDFTMPADKNKKLIFIAGGIGVTPFRSMIKYLIDKKEKRDIVVFYACKSPEDVAYREIFDKAQRELNIKIIYCIDPEIVTKETIAKYAPDFTQRVFYISGPRGMILAFQKALKESGVPKHHIKTDFFPGFA